MLQGLATWGLLVLAVTVTGVATRTALLGEVANVTLQANAQATDATTLLQHAETELWAVFVILLGGAMIAALAGAMTGRTHTMFALDHDETHTQRVAATATPCRPTTGRRAPCATCRLPDATLTTGVGRRGHAAARADATSTRHFNQSLTRSAAMSTTKITRVTPMACS